MTRPSVVWRRSGTFFLIMRSRRGFIPLESPRVISSHRSHFTDAFRTGLQGPLQFAAGPVRVSHGSVTKADQPIRKSGPIQEVLIVVATEIPLLPGETTRSKTSPP